MHIDNTERFTCKHMLMAVEGRWTTIIIVIIIIVHAFLLTTQ